MRAQLQKRKLLLERILDSVETQHKIAAAVGVRASLWASQFAFSAADDKNLQFPPACSKRHLKARATKLAWVQGIATILNDDDFPCYHPGCRYFLPLSL